MREIEVDHPRLVKEVLDVLNKGGVVVFPTETVYGLIADAENRKAVERVVRIKGRDLEKPMSILVSSFEMAKRYVVADERLRLLWEKFSPGPITFVVRASPFYKMKYIVSPSGKVGIRAPAYGLLRQLILSFGRAVTGTSANFSGEPAPKRKKELSRKLVEMVDLVVISKDPLLGVASTVVELNHEVKLLRKGPISYQEILNALREENPHIKKDI